MIDSCKWFNGFHRRKDALGSLPCVGMYIKVFRHIDHQKGFMEDNLQITDAKDTAVFKTVFPCRFSIDLCQIRFKPVKDHLMRTVKDKLMRLNTLILQIQIIFDSASQCYQIIRPFVFVESLISPLINGTQQYRTLNPVCDNDSGFMFQRSV